MIKEWVEVLVKGFITDNFKLISFTTKVNKS